MGTKYTADNSGNLNLSGDVNIATGKLYKINSTQITSLTGLSDGSSLARADATDTISGAWTHTNTLKLNDSVELHLGSDADFKIYHSGAHAYVNNLTGNIVIQASGENILQGWQNGAAALYHNNDQKLITSATGVTIAGTLGATTVTGINVTSGSDPGHTHTGASVPIDGSGSANNIARWSDSDTLTTSAMSQSGSDIVFSAAVRLGTTADTTNGNIRYTGSDIEGRVAGAWVPLTSQGHTIENDGTPVTQRDNINFTGLGVSTADAGGKTVVTIQGGHNIENEGTPLTFRENLNFKGNAVTASDNSPDTDVTINSTTMLYEEFVTGVGGAGPTVYDITVGDFEVGQDQIRVYLNGLLQRKGATEDYVETDVDTITFNSSNEAGDIVQVYLFVPGTAIITPTGAVEQQKTFTATANQAAGIDPFSVVSVGTYTLGGDNLKVYVNGALQIAGTNFTEDNDEEFTFSSGLTAGDTVQARWIEAVGNLVSLTPAVESQELFDAVQDQVTFPLAGNFNNNGLNLQVFVDGVKMTPGDDYAETDSETVTFGTGLNAGQKVIFRWVSTLSTNYTAIHQRTDRLATADQKVFGVGFTFVDNGQHLRVYNDGVLMRPGVGGDYYESSNSQVVFNTGRVAGSTVTFEQQGIAQSGSASTLNGLTADDLIQQAMLAA